MSLAACYVVNVQCDRPSSHAYMNVPRDQFTGDNRRAALAAMTRAGWRCYTPTGGDVVLCPACVKAGHTTADGVKACATCEGRGWFPVGVVKCEACAAGVGGTLKENDRG